MGVMNFRENLPLMLAGAALAMALIQMVHPVGYRVHPMLLLAVSGLLALRWLLRKQARRRVSMMEQVPEHPLGIGEEESSKG